MASRVDLTSSLSDTDFRHYTRLRLGLQLVRPGPCQHARAGKSGEKHACMALMDAAGAHCISCKIGGAVHAAHDEGCQIMAEATRAAGYFARREQIIPELATAKCQSPVLDIDAFGLAGADRLLIDFTLRSGMAERYHQGGKRDNNAAGSAEEDKLVRYPARGGVSVRGVAMEIMGRHGPDLTLLLAELADRARVAAVERGRAPARLMHKWRCRLSAMCARLVGRQVAQSLARDPHPWEPDSAS